MIMRRICNFIIMFALALSASAQNWLPDILGPGFEMRYVQQGEDYSGKVRSTIIRHRSDCADAKAVLYVHGFNDYFFQKEMAERFSAHCYDFYAVDLRKYGRSLMPGQKRCQARDISEYYADIDSALSCMVSSGAKDIVLMGHSTGGLIVSCYMMSHPDAPIKALVLNSPFLDWNMGKLECFIGAVSALGKLFPNVEISSGSGTAYSESLLKGEHGEWEYNDAWKSRVSPKVSLGWVRAINNAQHFLRKHKGDIHIPILLMYSSHSVNSDTWILDASRSDAVLDVADIRKYGRMLGPDVTSVKVNGGLHDLVLSSRNVRESLYTYLFQWLSANDK